MQRNAATQRLLFNSFCAAMLLSTAHLLSGCGCGGNPDHGDGPDMGTGGTDTGTTTSSGTETGTGTGTDTGTSTGTGQVADCACIDAFGADSLDDSAIQKLASEGLPKCFGGTPEELEKQASCLPHVVGKDQRNGMEVQVYYFCSDLCPDYGYVGIGYKDVADKVACCAAGGAPVIDPAWGGFAACAPPGTGAGDSSLCAK